MKKAILIFAAIILAFILCFGAGVSSIQTSAIPSDTLWLLHVDVEKYASSRMFKLLTDEGSGTSKTQRKAGKFFEKFRIDPLKDLKGITIYGRGKGEEEAVVAVSGNFDKAYLLGLLKADSSHKELTYGKHTIYSWEGKHFGVFAADNLVLLAQGEESLKSALDAMEGKIKDISSSPLIANVKKESADAIILAAAADISGMLGARQKPVILSKMRSATCSIAEKGETFNLKLDIATESPQVAKDLEQAIRGLIAMANLQLAETATAKILPQDINIALDGEKVRINAAYPTAMLVDLFKKHGFRHVHIGDLDLLSYF